MVLFQGADIFNAQQLTNENGEIGPVQARDLSDIENKIADCLTAKEMETEFVQLMPFNELVK